MTRFNRKSISTFIILIALSTPFTSAQFVPEGIWQGALSIQGVNLRIVFNITKESNGSLKATVDSPDQGVKDLQVKDVTIVKDSILMDIPVVAGVFQGRVNNDSTLDGTWKQRGFSLPLVMKKTTARIEVLRPQEPKGPYPYIEEEVTVENKSGGCLLAGTLTRPMKSERPVPAVVLITGSGPQDRDETIFNHKPFKVIADYLTRRGIAVLRCDDRGVGKSTGGSATATSADFATDALACLRYLTTRQEIDKTKIGFIGHSEGGMIAPMVASESHDVAFIVLLAGTSVPGEEILLMQSDLISRANGVPDSLLAINSEQSKKMYAVLNSDPDSTSCAKKLRKIILDAVRKTDPANVETDATRQAIDLELSQILSPWFRFFVRYDPRPALRKTHCPVLALNGEKDLQVAPKQNLPEIEKALKGGGNKNYSTRELAGLNHLFQTAKTGSPTEYAQIEETFSPEALAIIGDWIIQQTR